MFNVNQTHTKTQIYTFLNVPITQQAGNLNVNNAFKYGFLNN